MKKTMMALCMAAAASWVMTAAAQTQSTTAKSEKNTTKSGKSMMFTGCVEEGTTPGTYTLTNVSNEGGAWSSSGSGTSASGTSGTGTSGTSGTGSTGGSTSGSMGSEQSASTMTYELVPAKGVDLKSHVGHKVQVTATMDNSKDKSSGMSGTGTSGTSGSSGSGSTMSGQSGSSSMEMEHKLKVHSVKMISSSCSGQ